jgi:hypothetical protein
MSETCKTCESFFPIEKPTDMTEEEKAKLPTIGQCRRRAPAVGFVALLRMDMASGGPVPYAERCTAFPNVHDDVWCGEWQPRKSLTH